MKGLLTIGGLRVGVFAIFAEKCILEIAEIGKALIIAVPLHRQKQQNDEKKTV